MRACVPQGSSTSLTLFKFFIATYPGPCELVSAYADDVCAAGSSVNYPISQTEHALVVANWAEGTQLQISTRKSHITLITSDTNQYHSHLSQVRLRDTSLSLGLHHTTLRVTFNSILSFNRHIKNT